MLAYSLIFWCKNTPFPTPPSPKSLDLGMKATLLQPSPPSGHLHYALKTKISEKFRALDKKFECFAKLGLLLHVKNVF